MNSLNYHFCYYKNNYDAVIIMMCAHKLLAIDPLIQPPARQFTYRVSEQGGVGFPMEG